MKCFRILLFALPLGLPLPMAGAQHDPDPFAAPVESRKKLFDLDFPGGPVQDFVAAVERATGDPFNVIIPATAKDLIIPAVKVRQVTVQPLLESLSAASRENRPFTSIRKMVTASGKVEMVPDVEWVETGFTFSMTSYGDSNPVWRLNVQKPPVPPAPPAEPPTARFYQLKPGLEAGLKVEDILTVAQTAWQMMKMPEAEWPQVKVHEETGILIAVGNPDALAVIDSVLNELPGRKAADARLRKQPGALSPQKPEPKVETAPH